MLLSTFWSMLNEEFDPREAKRQFGRIAAGGTLGRTRSAELSPRGPWRGPARRALMLILAGLHLACGGFLAALMREAARRLVPPAGRRPKRRPRRTDRRCCMTLGAIVLLGSIGAGAARLRVQGLRHRDLGPATTTCCGSSPSSTPVSRSELPACSPPGKEWCSRSSGSARSILTLPATLAGGSFLALVVPGAAVAALARAAEAAVRGSLFRAGYETCYTPVPAGRETARQDLHRCRIGEGRRRARGGDRVPVPAIRRAMSALPWILSIAALVGLSFRGPLRRAGSRLPRSAGPEPGIAGGPLNVDTDLDLTTRSLVMRAPAIATRRSPALRRGSRPDAAGAGRDPAAAEPRCGRPTRGRFTPPSRTATSPIRWSRRRSVCCWAATSTRAGAAALLQAAGKVARAA